MKKFEYTYGTALRAVMFAVNPLKKTFLKTYCTIHKFINIQAIEILKNEGYTEQYDFFKDKIRNLNDGITWADQDFKSSNHFYHFSKGKGLYGFSDALTECQKYFNKATIFMKNGDMDKAMFFYGAACHLIQDATVPQHVNNKLLKSHRRFELWIISKFMTDYSFVAEKGIIRYKSLDQYVKTNALMANNTFIKFYNIENRDERYWKISTAIIFEAERTTAGVLLDIYDILKTNFSIA
ncbi:MAG TPA: zinc dependent phospholipase C family protein [Clostridiaceae bacterium]